MDNIQRDINRLELMSDDWSGLEAFSLATRFQDFVKYYFTRFLMNVKLSLKDFSKSELELYNKRYHLQIKQTLRDPLFSLKGFLVAIPKGMTKSYLETVESLIGLLASIASGTLVEDLNSVLLCLEKSDPSLLPTSSYVKKDFEQDKRTLGSLFSKLGLPHVPAEEVFSSLKEVSLTNELLLSTVKDYYPDILELNTLINKIEKAHSDFTPEHSDRIKDILMSCAYRTSIFASVMDQVLSTEHAFVKTLDILRKEESKR